MADAIRVADRGAGVLRLYGNYGGDVMNFDMAGDLVEFEDIRCTTALLADDVASAGKDEADKRRGVAGMVYAFKIAGAAAEEGRDLDAVTKVAQKAADACRSIGVALGPCTVPQAGKPTFEIGDTEMEIGMGIHGEPGVRRGELRPADEIANEMMDRLLDDLPLAGGDRVSVLVNSLGATPPEELYILYRTVRARLEGTGRDDRHAAGRALRDVDGDGRRLVHAVPARRGARDAPEGGRATARSGRSPARERRGRTRPRTGAHFRRKALQRGGRRERDRQGGARGRHRTPEGGRRS